MTMPVLVRQGHVTGFLTLTELAAYVGISPRTISRLRRRGELPPCIRVGGQVRVAIADVEAWCVERRESRPDGEVAHASR